MNPEFTHLLGKGIPQFWKQFLEQLSAFWRAGIYCVATSELSGRGLMMIHRCKSLFSSACLCVRGQPHSLFHSIITLVSLKIFAQKKPTVWPLFSLGFQGTFPSSPESKGEAALWFSQSIPDSKRLQKDPFGSKTHWSRITTFQVPDGGRCGSYYFVSVLW